MEIDDRVDSRQKYLDMSEYFQWQEEQNSVIKAILRISDKLIDMSLH